MVSGIWVEEMFRNSEIREGIACSWILGGEKARGSERTLPSLLSYKGDNRENIFSDTQDSVITALQYSRISFSDHVFSLIYLVRLKKAWQGSEANTGSPQLGLDLSC